MVRMQVYLTEAQRRLLEKKAKSGGFPVAELIRRAIDAYLGSAGYRTDPQSCLDRTLGALPDLEVPPRSEWDRTFSDG